MLENAMSVVLSASQLHSFAREMLVALGMPDDDAVIVADSFVWAGLRDAITHSIIRIEQIAKRSRGGGLSLEVDWTPVRATGGVAVLNANYAWGTIGATRGMRLAVESARKYGVGMTSIRNCDNTGALGMHTSHAIEARMIGIAITNTTPFMPAWGGAKKLLGDQAFSIGAPSGKHHAVVLDESLGAEKLNVLREAAASGTPVAPNTILTAAGEPTTDAKEWLNGGMLLPAGGHRGGGLVLMWEVLTGVLAGGHMLSDVLDMSRLDAKLGNSLFVMAIDPSKLMPIEEFLARMDRLVEEVHASPPMAGVERVRLPGERRERIAAERRVTGIPIPDDHVTRLRPLANELGVRFPADS
jgi:LDH2 family malate/lactate/ureidoglycolate dehydrogenase